MSDLLKKIDLLEREVAHLTEERRFAMNTLEMAANMITFDSGPADLIDQVHTLSETASKILSMLSFEAICFYLINEEDASFYLAYCEPEEFQPQLEKMIDLLIEDQTFAWALGRKRPVRVEIEKECRTLLLHSLTTASRTRGMFVGIPIEEEDEFESPLPLLTLVLHSSANILESIELYHKLRTVNRSLEANVAKLEQSEQELQKQRLYLEELIEQKNGDLAVARESGEQTPRIKNRFLPRIMQEISTSLADLIKKTNDLLDSELDARQQDQARAINKEARNLATIISNTLGTDSKFSG